MSQICLDTETNISISAMLKALSGSEREENKPIKSEPTMRLNLASSELAESSSYSANSEATSKKSLYKPNDSVIIIDDNTVPSLAKIKAQEKTAIAAEDGDFSRLQPYLKELSRSQRIMFILEEMMAAQSDKSILLQASDFINTARTQLNVFISNKEALEALENYKSHHPEVIDERDLRNRTTRPTHIMSPSHEQKVNYTFEQNKFISCTVEQRDFKISIELPVNNFEQLLTILCRTLRSMR